MVGDFNKASIVLTANITIFDVEFSFQGLKESYKLMYYIFAPSTAFLLVRNEYTSPEQKSNRTRDGSNSLDDIPT